MRNGRLKRIFSGFLPFRKSSLLFSLFFFLVIIPAELFGQEILFCLDHTQEGDPLARGQEFDLARYGQEVDLLFRNFSPIESSKLYFFIDERVEGRYIEFDTKSLDSTEGRDWAAIRYQFERTGVFRVMVLDEQKREICRNEVIVNVREEDNSPSYYSGTKLLFCREAPDGVPDTVLNELRVRAGEMSSLAIFLNHSQPLNTAKIIVDVWIGSGDGAGSYYETIEFEVDPSWSYTQFPYEFRGAGVYTFRVYNQKEVWMVAESIEVRME